MANWFGRKKKKEEELQEVDMSRGPPRTPGAPPIERPVVVTGRGEEDKVEYEEVEPEDEYDIGPTDMADGADAEVRAPVSASRASEVSVGKPALNWEIRKRLWHNRPGTEVVETIMDSEPPSRQYIEEELKPIYGGGLYMVYHNDRHINRYKIDGPPRWQEDVAAEQQRHEATMGDGTPLNLQSLMWKMMTRTDDDLKAMREENVKLRDERMRAEMKALENKLDGLQANTGGKAVKEYLKEIREMQELMPGYKDPMDRLLDNPAIQNSINTFISKVSEVDFSKADMFAPRPVPGAPGAVPGAGATVPSYGRNDYIATIQQAAAQAQKNIPVEIIARAVDKALLHEDPNPDKNLGAAVEVLDQLMDARRALAHLQTTVMEGKATDLDAATLIIERFPIYAQYLMDHDYAAMMQFLEEFNDIEKMKSMIVFAKRDDVRAHIESIVQLIRKAVTGGPEKPKEVVLQDMQRIEEGPR